MARQVEVEFLPPAVMMVVVTVIPAITAVPTPAIATAPIPAITPAIGTHSGDIDWRGIIASTVPSSVSSRIGDAATEAERDHDCGEGEQRTRTKETWHLTLLVIWLVMKWHSSVAVWCPHER
jgi:hypothetical protein